MATISSTRRTRSPCGSCTAPIREPLSSIHPSAERCRELRKYQQFSNTNAVLKLTTIVSNTLVNELRGSFQRLFSKLADDLPAGWTPQNLGHHAHRPQPDSGAALSFLINGFGAGGFLEPAFSPTNQYQFQDQISWSHGRHTIRAGAEVEKAEWNLDFAGLERGWLFIGSFTNLLAANNPGNIFQCLYLRFERPSRCRRYHPRLSRNQT